MIVTAIGRRPVETLRPGDRVVTRDNGLAEIAWVGRRSLSHREIRGSSELTPILISRGALGPEMPDRDMIVSPNHRFLVDAARRFPPGRGEECLAAARQLTDNLGIRQVPVLGVSYIHFLCERHQVVRADNVWTESFRPTQSAIGGLGMSQRLELVTIFPELGAGIDPEAARMAAEEMPLWKRRLMNPPAPPPG